MRYSISQNSLPGTRKLNQDRLGYAERDNAVLMVVADGLGGYQGGELAAQTLVDTMIEYFERTRQSMIKDPAAFLVLAISYAHKKINRCASAAGIKVSLPRTTCVACLVQDGYAYWGHVGDSRLYHIRDRSVISRTVDDSTLDQMYNEGLISELEYRAGQAHLLRCVGGEKRPEVNLGVETRLETGDILVLCSDGVWRAYSDRDLAKYASLESTDDSVDQLLSRAEKRFRRECDNLSALLFRWDGAPTSKDPLLGLAAPELDQRQLWRDTRKRRAEQRRQGSEPAPVEAPTDEIESTIAEIESFVKDVDELLG
jgi:serine/threonine protein phosphatase PrpC